MATWSFEELNPGRHRSATGIMLGWSTAFLVSLLAKLRLLTHDWLTPDQ
jgi:hypothetical protein